MVTRSEHGDSLVTTKDRGHTELIREGMQEKQMSFGVWGNWQPC